MTKYYIVQKDDTLCKIAKKFNTTVEEIAKINGITNIDYIKKGDIIQICQ